MRHKKAFQILERDGKQVVRGHVHRSGLFGFHNEGYGWKVTHLPTGFLLHSYGTLKKAREKVNELLGEYGEAFQWDNEKVDYWKAQADRICGTVRLLMQAM